VSYRLKLIIAFAAVYLIWGSTFFCVKLALDSFPPFLLSSLRLLIAGGSLAIYCSITRQAPPKLNDIQKNAFWGIIIFIGGMVMVVWAQQFISSSLASSIIATPFWFIILDKPQWKFYFSSKWIVGGLLLSLIGVIILMSFKQGRAGTGDEIMQPVAVLTIVTGSLLWAGGSLYMKYNPSGVSIYVSTSIQLFSAGLFCLLLSYFTPDFGRFSIDEVKPSSVYALLYLATVSSLLTMLAYQWLIREQPPAIVSTYSYVNPLVATLLGWLFADEHISLIQLAALGIILTGVLFVNIPKYQAMKSAS